MVRPNRKRWKLNIGPLIGVLYDSLDVRLGLPGLGRLRVERRYPEGIAYCDRLKIPYSDVNVTRAYEKALRVSLLGTPTADRKIDHLIPLCAGGSNELDNLWPQHKLIGQYTDPIEPRLCLMMQLGLMKQTEAVDLIRAAKSEVNLTPEICEDLDRRLTDQCWRERMCAMIVGIHQGKRLAAIID